MAEFSHTTETFEKIYQTLNQAQKKAVDTIEGPVMVIAGPGTGKTQILAVRIANILRQTDTPPDAILALAFTESAVHSMRERLLSVVGTAAYKIPIFTFHGLANDIIERFPESFPRIIGSTPAADVDQIDIVREILEHHADPRIRPYGNPLHYLAPIRSVIGELKRENIGPTDFKKIVAEQELALAAVPEHERVHQKGAHAGKIKSYYTDEAERIAKNKSLVDVYAKYEKMLAKRRLYDFDDMIRDVVAALGANNDLLLRLQEQYQYILADEHQDANAAQNAFLELLVNFYERPNLFIVGDDKQAIFRFQGASLDNFLYFKKRFPAATVISLEENYRSTQLILDAAFGVIGNNTVTDSALRVRLRAARRDTSAAPHIKLYECSTPQHEVTFVANTIAERLQKNPSAEIAIIYRTNSDAVDILRALQSVGVPYTIRSSQDVFSDPAILTAITLFRVVAAYGDDPHLARLLYASFLHTTPLDVFKITRFADHQKYRLADVIAHGPHLEAAGVADAHTFLAIAKRFSTLATFAKNHSLLETIDHILYESGFLAHTITTPNAARSLAAIELLTAEAKKIARTARDGGRLEDLLRFIDMVIEHHIPLASMVPIEQTGGVQLMTAHKSKGLEFETVYIIGAEEGHWGGRRDRTTFKIFNHEGHVIDEDDERRLFYVAVTRAKREVNITWSAYDDAHKPRLPSQFINEIDARFVERGAPTETPRIPVTKQPAPHTQSFTDRDYIRSLFSEQGWSATALNNFLKCPWQYFFRNLVRLPEAQTKQQLYGTAVHKALDQFFRRWGDERDMGRTEFLDFFETCLRQQPLTATEYATSLEKGKKALAGWYQWHHAHPLPRSGLVEYSIPHVSYTVVLPDGTELIVPLRGKLDRITFLNNRDVIVTDFKTAKPKSRNELRGMTKHADGDYVRQLVFYSLLLTLYDGGRWHMCSGEINFIEPDSRGKYHQEQFDITDEDRAALQSVIADASREIWTGAFWDKTCTTVDCPYCRLRQDLTK